MTAASLIALALAGAGTTQLFAGTPAGANTPVTISNEHVSGGPNARQDVEMSEHGLAAMNNIYLARIAVNDGTVDGAKDLLKQAKTLLDQVKSEDRPMKVTADVKVGDKQAKKETSNGPADLIPIMGDTQIVEAYAPEQSGQSAGQDTSAQASPQSQPQSQQAQPQAKTAASDNGQSSSEQAAAGNKPSHGERMAAVQKARQQLRNGDRKGAAETLRLVELDLVSQIVSMPLHETTQHVDKALSLIDKDKLHQANLELKKAKDDLVVETSVAVGPSQSKAASANGGETGQHVSASGSKSDQHPGKAG